MARVRTARRATGSLVAAGRVRAARSLAAAWSAAWPRDGSARSLEQRRARAMVAATLVFVAVVVLTSFPFGEVLSQRAALASTDRQLANVQAENAALGRQAAALGHASTVVGLARHTFGFVHLGQSAFDVLPLPGATAPSSPGAGHVPLDGPPVAPGSARSAALMGVQDTGPPTGGPGGAGTSAPARGYWARVVRSLEFWH